MLRQYLSFPLFFKWLQYIVSFYFYFTKDFIYNSSTAVRSAVPASYHRFAYHLLEQLASLWGSGIQLWYLTPWMLHNTGCRIWTSSKDWWTGVHPANDKNDCRVWFKELSSIIILKIFYKIQSNNPRMVMLLVGWRSWATSNVQLQNPRLALLLVENILFIVSFFDKPWHIW